MLITIEANADKADKIFFSIDNYCAYLMLRIRVETFVELINFL